MNWYFVVDGNVALRSEDDVPDTFTHPTKGSVSGFRAATDEERADMGWLRGIPAPARPDFDPRTQKATIVPTPTGLDEWAAYRKLVVQPPVSIADDVVTVVAPPVPTVLETWTIAPLTDAEAAEAKNHAFAGVKSQRAMLLQRTDYLMLSDAPIDDATRKLWTAYRQALRDLPAQFADPRDVVWPTPPGDPDLGFL